MTQDPPIPQGPPTERHVRVPDYAGVPERGMYRPEQGLWRTLLEITFVFGCFCAWLVVQEYTAIGSKLDSLTGGSPLYGQVAANGCLVLILVALVTVTGGSSHRDLGLRRAGAVRDLGLGFAAAAPAYCATAALSIVLALVATHFLGSSLEAMAEDKSHILSVVSTVPPWMVVPLALFIGLYEELLFRGFLLGRLARLTGSIPGAIVSSSVAFGLMHLPSQGWIGFVQTSFLGLILALLCVWRKSLWPAMACHAGIDMAGMYLVLILAWLQEHYGLL